MKSSEVGPTLLIPDSFFQAAVSRPAITLLAASDFTHPLHTFASCLVDLSLQPLRLTSLFCVGLTASSFQRSSQRNLELFSTLRLPTTEEPLLERQTRNDTHQTDHSA